MCNPKGIPHITPEANPRVKRQNPPTPIVMNQRCGEDRWLLRLPSVHPSDAFMSIRRVALVVG